MLHIKKCKINTQISLGWREKSTRKCLAGWQQWRGVQTVLCRPPVLVLNLFVKKRGWFNRVTREDSYQPYKLPPKCPAGSRASSGGSFEERGYDIHHWLRGDREIGRGCADNVEERRCGDLGPRLLYTSPSQDIMIPHQLMELELG